MALRDDLLVAAPEFASETSERLDQFITWAGLSINRTRWPAAKADLAQILLAAHMMTLFAPGRADAGGPVTAERVGDLSRNYGTITVKGAEELTSTTYGQQFLFLRRSVFKSFLVV